jgi:Fe-S-cluster containining protein
MRKFSECDGCYGYCCCSYDTLLIKDDEITRIAKYLDIPEEQFKKTYINMTVQRSSGAHELKFGARPCVFWTLGRCGIYKVAPSGCKKLEPMLPIGGITCKMWHKMKAGL